MARAVVSTSPVLGNAVVVSYTRCMSDRAHVVTAAELEKLTPQQRADLVIASHVPNLTDLTPEFREVVEREAARLGEQRRSRG